MAPLKNPEAQKPGYIKDVRQLIPVVFLLALLASGCMPQVGGVTQEPSGVPEHNSPIFFNGQDLAAGFTIHFASNEKNDTYPITTTATCIDDMGASCNEHVYVVYPDLTQDQRKKGDVPVEVHVTADGEEGLRHITVKSQECAHVDTRAICGEPSAAYTFDVMLDHTPPPINSFFYEQAGHITGQSIDTFSPIASARVITADGKEIAQVVPNTQGQFALSYIPSVGTTDLMLEVTDMAGNTSIFSFSETYNFGDFTITSMTVGGKDVDVAHFTQPMVGIAANKSDVLFKTILPEGVDPTTFVISAEQQNWYSLFSDFGMTARIPCEVLGVSGLQVVARCEPATSSGYPMRVHVTYKDQYGNSADEYYPEKTFFPVDMPALTPGQWLLYFAERVAAYGGAFLTTATIAGWQINRKRFQSTRTKAMQVLSETDSIPQALRVLEGDSMLSPKQRAIIARALDVESERKKRLIREEKAHTLVSTLRQYPFLSASPNRDVVIDSYSLATVVEVLNNYLKLGIDTQDVMDRANGGDGAFFATAVTKAVTQWMNTKIMQPAGAAQYDWKKFVEGMNDEKNEVINTMGVLARLQIDQIFSPMRSSMVEMSETDRSNLQETALLYLYFKNYLMPNGKINRKIATSLFNSNHGKMTIESALTILQKWGGNYLSLAEQLEGEDKKRAQQFLQAQVISTI